MSTIPAMFTKRERERWVMVLWCCSSYQAHLVAVWVYGSCLGGYNYTLKMSIYHAVRARKSNSNIFPINVIRRQSSTFVLVMAGLMFANLPADSELKYQHEQTLVVM